MSARIAIAIPTFVVAFVTATAALALGAWQLAAILFLIAQLPFLTALRAVPEHRMVPPLWVPTATCRPRQRAPRGQLCRAASQIGRIPVSHG